MPKPRVYVETTIPSAYHTSRTDAAMIVRQVATRAWWEWASRSCELLTSRVVLRELARGSSALVPERRAMVKHLELLRTNREIIATAALYIRQKLMPRDIRGDALHLALASASRMRRPRHVDYHHLANPNKLERITTLNRELGLRVPRIVTPLDLMEGIS